MINIVQGFEFLTREPSDKRLVLSIDQMLKINDNHMPDKYITICKDNNSLYIYDKSSIYHNIDENEKDYTNIGKFTKYSDDKNIHIIISDKIINPDENGNIVMPLMDKNNLGVGTVDGIGIVANSGIISLDFNTVIDRSIPAKKVDFQELVIDANE